MIFVLVIGSNRRLMKNWILLSCLLLLTTAGYSQREIIDKVVATVGSEIVLLSDLEEQRALLAAQQGTLPENARCLILDQIMAQKLLVNQAKLDSLVITDEEVEAQLDARIEQILEYMNGDIQAFQDYYGQTVQEVKDAFRIDLRDKILADRMRGQIMADVTVTPSEVKAFFAQIPLDSLPYFNSEVEIGELVLKPEVSEAEKQRAIDELTAIRAQLTGGADFAELAQKYSNDFASARVGGDLGWTKRGKFVPEFEAEAYNLDPGEISPIFESPFGYHILQLVARRGNSINTRHILIQPEIQPADLERTQVKLDSIRHLIVSDSLSFSQAVKKFGYKEAQSYTNDGRMRNPNTGNTFFEVSELDPDIYFTIDTMNLSGISSAFAFTQGRETLYHIIQLQSRTSPHKANLTQDYSKIREATISQKKGEFVNNWIQDIVESTFIQVDPLFDGKCDGVLDKWTNPQRIAAP